MGIPVWTRETLTKSERSTFLRMSRKGLATGGTAGGYVASTMAWIVAGDVTWAAQE
jgi:hypothetical protein